MGLPVHARILRLYITHALHAHNAAPNEAFQNIIGDAQPEGLLWPNFVSLSRKSLACCLVSPCSLLLRIPAHASQKKSGRPGRVQTGLDVLEAEKFAPLRGKHVGLITNHTGLDAQGRSSIEVFFHAPGLQLVALFSPEHGISGRADDKYSSSKDPTTGLTTYSLYGESLRPTDEMLAGIDTLVFDIQDAGVRFYTYTATMAYCMEEAAKHNIAFYVLDRPNLLGGEIIEGPILDSDKTSIVGYFPLPIRYGLTIGELAQFFNAENHLNCDVHVIAMINWHRNYFFESTGIRWVPPSPNLRTVKGSIVYPGIEILQNAGVSVGRGTEAPFEEFGAPWMDGRAVADKLNAIHLPGLRFADQPFIPSLRSLRRTTLRRCRHSHYGPRRGPLRPRGLGDRRHFARALPQKL